MYSDQVRELQTTVDEARERADAANMQLLDKSRRRQRSTSNGHQENEEEEKEAEKSRQAAFISASELQCKELERSIQMYTEQIRGMQTSVDDARRRIELENQLAEKDRRLQEVEAANRQLELDLIMKRSSLSQNHHAKVPMVKY
jgi:hypothetical protein